MNEAPTYQDQCRGWESVADDITNKMSEVNYEMAEETTNEII